MPRKGKTKKSNIKDRYPLLIFNNKYQVDKFDRLSLEKQEREDELFRIRAKNLELETKINTLENNISKEDRKYRQYKKQYESLQSLKEKYTTGISNIEKKHIELKKEVEKIKLKHKKAKEEITIINEEKKLGDYNLNKKKVKLQQSKSPESYKLLGIYLTATTIIGILLAVYYMFFFTKG